MDLDGDGSSQQVQDDSLKGARTTALGTQIGFRGVAVTATARDEIRTFTITFGAGAVGVGVSAGVDVVTADTEAYIAANAQVNASTLGANAAQSVLVGAGDDFYHLSVGIGVGVGSVGVAPAVGVNIVDNTTLASIGNNALVNAKNDILVEASGKENVVMVGMGVAAGAVGVGAVVDVLSISNQTTASIGNSSTVHAGGDVLVSANDDTHVLELSGALAGGFVGVGGAVGVMLIDKTTDATIGTNAHVDADGAGSGLSGILDGGINGGTSFSTTSVDGVILQAQSSEDIVHIVAAGGVGFVGVSGAVGVTLIHSTTDAVVGGGAVINGADQAIANGNQSIYVNASNDVDIHTYVIGVAGGFVGVTGAVDVGTLNNNIKAEVQTGAKLTAKNDVDVHAVGLKHLTGFTISGAGGFVGAGASVNVWSIGTKLEKQYSDNDGHSANSVRNDKGDPDSNAADQAQTGTSFVTGNQGIGSLTGNGANPNSNANRVQSGAQKASAGISGHAPTSVAITTLENQSPVPPGTSAVIHSGVNVIAGDSIDVKANEVASGKETLGQVAGGVVGVGAAVAIFSISDNVTASDDGTNSAGGNLSVNAILNSTVDIIALDLAAGFVGLGAGVVVVNDNSVTQATLGSVSKAHDVTVAADATRSITELSGQASIGAVGAGATFTRLNIHGSTTAAVNANSIIGNVSPVSSLTVSAHSTVSANMETDAISAGIGATNANFAFLDADPTISATIGDKVTVTSSGAINVNTTASFDDQAHTFGVSAGGLAVGVSLTEVTVAPTITSSIGTQSTINANSLNVAAINKLPASNYVALAEATGSAGALVGITSTNSQVTNNSKVKSFVANAAKLTVTGAIAVTALNNTRQKASADSNSFGLIAAGIATSSTSSNTDTEAYLGATATVKAGSLSIGATGTDDNFSYTNAGAGGLVAGAAEIAHTKTVSTDLASVGDSSNVTLTNSFSVISDHTSRFNSQVTTFAGGLLAGTGADVDNKVTTNVTTSVGKTVSIDAFNINMSATNHVDKPWLTGSTPQNIKGTTGGLVSGAGASDTTEIDVTTLVTVGNNAVMIAKGTASNNEIFQLRANNDFSVHDKIAFETGGVLSGAGADATINVSTDIAHVTIGTNAKLSSQGRIDMTARGQGELTEDVEADTFGLGTVSVGTSTAEIAPDNLVLIGSGSIITAYGDLTLGAGMDAPGEFDSYKVEGRFDGFAGSLIPISDLGANAFLTQHNNVTINSTAHLMGARQINLDAQYIPIADMTAYAKAVSWASDLADAILKLTGGGGVEVHAGESLSQALGTVTNNGIVETGINRVQSLTLDSTGNIANPIKGTATPGVTFKTTEESVSSPLIAELAYDQTQLQNYGSTNKTLYDFYKGEIDRITNLLVSQGLAEIQTDGKGNPVVVPIDHPVLTVTVDPIWAEAGRVDVRANQFTGSGQFIAPSDASVTIINHSPAFLNIRGINIPANNGGLYYDGAQLTKNSAINNANVANAKTDNEINHYFPPEIPLPASFNLTNVAGGPSAIEPSIVIKNDFDANQYNLANPGKVPLLWPDITILAQSSGGTGVFNLGGSVLIQESPAASKGNINIYGPLQAKTIQIITNGAVSIQGLSTYAVGATPYTQWDAVTTGPYDTNNDMAPGVKSATPAGVSQVLNTIPSLVNLFGSRITINADFIDVNGIIQSGQDKYNLTLDLSSTLGS